jgi:hypothetical protein
MELFGSGIIEFRRPTGIFDRGAMMVYPLTERVSPLQMVQGRAVDFPTMIQVFEMPPLNNSLFTSSCVNLSFLGISEPV